MGDGSAALWGWGGWSIHPLYEAVQTIRAKTVCASVSLMCGVRRRSGLVNSVLEAAKRAHDVENIRKSRGLNSLFGQGSLRIPLRLVLRPAQEVRTSQQTNKNLLPIT